MPDELNSVSPRKIMDACNRGQKRLANFRAARLHFIQEYVGPYYDKTEGEVGTSAINLLFNAIRILVPTMVFNFPKHTVLTPYLQARDYANLLGLALDQHDIKINIRDTYRAVIVDALFTLGIIKTGLARSKDVYALDEDTKIDAGTIYSEKVDFDNFVADPDSREHMFADARFLGDRIILPRRVLLDSGLYKNDLVERLPRAGDDEDRNRRSQSISMRNIQIDQNHDLEDDVAIRELWFPTANAVVTVPGDDDVLFDDYMRVDDYYGVKEGPYTFLALTPPVPGNPLPVPSVGIWYDLHVLTNRMAKKVIEQAERQKSIVTYKRASADDAEQMKNAGDGETVAVDDPDGAKVQNFGGQQNSNEVHLAELMNWFNMMSANTEQIGGLKVEAKSATAATMLQQNAAIGLEDMKDLVYTMASQEARKRAWYMHTDPMIQIPLVRRQMMPAMQMPGQPFMTMPTIQDVQVILTPETRSGDFLDYVFNIQPESMGRRDSKMRLQQEMAFAQQILPATMTAAQVSMQLGIPFNAAAFLVRMAKDMGIEWLDEVLYDPMFQMQMQQQMMMGPQAMDSKGVPQPNPNLGPQMAQNGQPANVRSSPPDDQQQFNQGAQSGADEGQRMMRLALGSAFRPKVIQPAFANEQGI
jgi:hypothetical protein